MTAEHKIKRLLNLYDGDLCYILDEFEKIRAVALAAEKYWQDVKDSMPHGAELLAALKAWREE